MSFSLTVGAQTISADDLPELLERYQLFPHLVRELLVDRAIAPIAIDPQAVDLAETQFFASQQVAPEQRQAWLAHQQIDPEQFRDRLARDLKIERFKRERWGSQVSTLFSQQKAQLDKAIYSLIRVKEVDIARELYFRLSNAELPFTDLAADYSQGPEALTKGLVGPVALGSLVPSMAELLRQSRPGQLHAPRQLEEWFVIVQLEHHLPAQLDEAMREQLLQQMFEGWLQQELQAFLAPQQVAA